MLNRNSQLVGTLILSMAGVGIPISSFATYPQSQESIRNPSVGPGVANHPVGIRPGAAMRIPSGWPLADGALTCMTCHSTPPIGKNAAANLRHQGVKDADPKAFCMNCHRDSGAGTAAHWQALPNAHITIEQNRESSARESYDAASRSCLSCHDGVNAPDASHSSSGQSFSGFGDRSREHPVGIRYPFSGKTRAGVPLRPASSVPGTVSLAGGVVSCVSCHNLYAADEHRLSVPIEGSQLCFACHDLD